MYSIDKLDLNKQKAIQHSSQVCNVAVSVGYQNPLSDVDYRVKEISQSFFNQWRFTIEAYLNLFNLFQELNACSDVRDKITTLSQYDIFSIEHEKEFRDYSYLLIINIKTHIDLLACLVDISLNQVVREESQLPDYINIAHPKYKLPPELISEFKRLKDKATFPWLSQIKEIRDKIIHRGYQLKPSICFQKSSALMMQVYQGTDFYTNELIIDIGEIFNSFLVDMPLIDDAIAKILLNKITILNKKISCETSYSFDGLVSMYSYNEIEAQ